MVGSPLTPDFTTPGYPSYRRLMPPPTRRMLPRRRVDLVLGVAGEYPLTLVSAPAGSGKSVALAFLAQRGGWPTVWVRLRSTDDAPGLVRQIAAAVAGSGVAVDPSISDPVALMAVLHRQLPDDTLLVLDDTHEIDGNPVLEAVVAAVVEHTPPQLHLILAGRRRLSTWDALPATARREALEIGQLELAFSEDEVRSLFAGSPWLSTDDLEFETARYRGWPFALHSMARRQEPGNDRVLAAIRLFAENEVLAPQSLELRQWLFNAASLPVLYPEDVSDLAKPLALQGLEQAADRVLFLEPDPSGAARFQPWFREFLLSERGAAAVANRDMLLACARRHQNAGRTPLAVATALEAGATRWAADVIVQAAGLGPVSAAAALVDEALQAGSDGDGALSWWHALTGDGPAAFAGAQRAIANGLDVASRRMLALGYVRLGDALQLLPRPDQGRVASAYRRALQVGRGDLRVAAAARAGMLAAGLEPPAEPETTGWDAVAGFRAAGTRGDLTDVTRQAARLLDASPGPIRECLALLWLAIADPQGRPAVLPRLFELAGERGLTGVLSGSSLFGPSDPAMLVPLLLAGRALPATRQAAVRCLAHGFPSIAADPDVSDYHPGYTLRIQTLGRFRVWRGPAEIEPRGWGRERSRQLLQLLVTQRGRWLQRETICQALWPELDPAAAVNQFNVTLNGLNAALEPDRPPRAQPFFIRRHRLAYAFAPSFGAWIDADEFELRSRVAPPDDPAATRRNRLVALALYQGDYLEEAAWDPWTIDERQRLLSRYLETAISAAAAELEADRPDAAGELAEAALRRDASYEDAWVVLIRSWLARGNRSQALRAWQRCQAALSAELGVEPLPSTRALLELPDR